MIEMDGIGLDRAHAIDQHLQPIEAIDRQVGITEPAHSLGAEIECVPSPSGIPQPQILGAGWQCMAERRSQTPSESRARLPLGLIWMPTAPSFNSAACS
jgi:hypothetical protein